LQAFALSLALVAAVIRKDVKSIPAIPLDQVTYFFECL
jgi:hypothetical protein